MEQSTIITKISIEGRIFSIYEKNGLKKEFNIIYCILMNWKPFLSKTIKQNVYLYYFQLLAFCFQFIYCF